MFNQANVSYETIVNQVINEINNNLAKLGQTPHKEAVRNAVRPPIQNALQRFKNQHKQLYKKLSLQLHPDHCCNTLPFFNINKEFKTIPFHVLTEQMSADFEGLNSLHDLLKNKKMQEQTFVQKVMVSCMSFYNEYHRYPEPLRSIVEVLRLFIISAIGFSFFGSISMMAVMGVLLLNDFFKTYHLAALNVMTQQAYDEILMKDITIEKKANFARKYLNNNADDIDDESVIKLYLRTYFEEEYTWLESKYQNEMFLLQIIYLLPEALQQSELAAQNAKLEKIRREIDTFKDVAMNSAIKNNTVGLEHLDAVYKAFCHAISKPLPEAWHEVFISLLLRLMQATLMLPVLLIEATFQLLNIFIYLLLIPVLTAALPVVFLTNLPLYIYDVFLAFKKFVSDAPQVADTALVVIPEPHCEAPSRVPRMSPNLFLNEHVIPQLQDSSNHLRLCC